MERYLKMLPRFKSGDILHVVPVEAPDGYKESAEVYHICYLSGGCHVMGYAAFPKVETRVLDSIVYNRGGNREFGTLRPETVCRFAAEGYAVFGSQYRGNAGGTGAEQFGGADVDDVIKLIDIVLSLPGINPKGVYMVGHSRGGMMTYLACARDTRIKAAVVLAGMSDCFMMYETREDSMKQVFHELVGGGSEQKREAFTARSATCWPEKIIPPVLICQGTEDWRVVPQMSYKMYEKLKAAGKECRLIVYERADHSLKGTNFVHDACDWLGSHPLA